MDCLFQVYMGHNLPESACSSKQAMIQSLQLPLSNHHGSKITQRLVQASLPVEAQAKSFQVLPDCNTVRFSIAVIITQHVSRVSEGCYSYSYSVFEKHTSVRGDGLCSTNIPATLQIHLACLRFKIIQLRSLIFIQ